MLVEDCFASTVGVYLADWRKSLTLYIVISAVGVAGTIMIGVKDGAFFGSSSFLVEIFALLMDSMREIGSAAFGAGSSLTKSCVCSIK